MRSRTSSVGSLIRLTVWVIMFAVLPERARGQDPASSPASQPTQVLFSRDVEARDARFGLRATIRDGTRVLWKRKDGTPIIGPCEILEVEKRRTGEAGTPRGAPVVIFRSLYDFGIIPLRTATADVAVDGPTGTVYLANARGPDFWITSFDIDAVPVDVNGRFQITERLPPDVSDEELDAAIRRSAERHFRNVARHLAERIPREPIDAITIEKDGDNLVLTVRRHNEPSARRYIWSLKSNAWQ